MEIFDEYGFPAVYPPHILSEMRHQLRLSDEEFHQLHLCFDAASNLYSRISLKKMHELCCHYLSPISEEDFGDAAEVIAHEGKKHYAIVRREIFHKESPSDGPMDWELVANHLYELDDEFYYNTEALQSGKPWYAPDRSEFLKYADQFYIESTPQQDLMVRYLQNSQCKLHCPPAEIVDELYCLLRMDEPFQSVIDEAQRLGVRFQDPRDFQQFIALLLKMSHHTRRYIHQGHTPAELGLPEQTAESILKEVSYDNDYVDPLEKIGPMLRAKLHPPATISSKPSRNAPCPCGSGRKYKNCCGK